MMTEPMDSERVQQYKRQYMFWEGVTGHVVVELCEEIERLQDLVDRRRPTSCEWSFGEINGYKAWYSMCAGWLTLPGGTPEEIGFRYCPFCGGALVEAEVISHE